MMIPWTPKDGPLCYLATPYTKYRPSIEAAFIDASKLAAKLMLAGVNSSMSRCAERTDARVSARPPPQARQAPRHSRVGRDLLDRPGQGQSPVGPLVGRAGMVGTLLDEKQVVQSRHGKQRR